MLNIQAVKQKFYALDEHRGTINGAVMLIAGIVLLALAAQQLNIHDMNLNWIVNHTYRVLEGANMTKLIIFLGVGGSFFAGGIWAIKDWNLQGKNIQKREIPPLQKRLHREGRFIKVALTLVALVAGSFLLYYGLHHLSSLDVANNFSNGKFYPIGYLDKNYTIEWATTAWAVGSALAMWGILELTTAIAHQVRGE